MLQTVAAFSQKLFCMVFFPMLGVFSTLNGNPSGTEHEESSVLDYPDSSNQTEGGFHNGMSREPEGNHNENMRTT